MKIRPALFLLIISQCVQHTLAGNHFTVRLKNPKSWSSPDVELLRFSPDASELTVATSRGMQFIRTRDGEVTGRIGFTPFAMEYTKDGSILHAIATRQSKLLRVADKYSLPMNYKRKNGYVGIRLNERNGKLLISHVDADSPADSTKLIRIGDELVGVGQGKADQIVSVVGKTSKQVVRLLKGLPGTYLRLSVISRGSLDPQTVLVRRADGSSNAGRRQYKEFDPPVEFDNVVRCMVNGYHEFRSARTGRTVSAFRLQNINGNRGTPGISNDSKLYAWIGKYRVIPRKAMYFHDSSSIDSSSILSTSGTDASQVAGSAFDRFGSSRKSGDFFGVEIYDIATRTLKASFPISVDPRFSSGLYFRGVHFSEDAKQLIVGTQSRFHVYDIQSGNRTTEIVIDQDALRPMIMSSDFASGLAAAGGDDGHVRIVDVANELVVQKVSSRSEEEITHVALSRNARKLAFHVDGVIHIVDIEFETLPKVAAITD